jgi:tripartite-type tricarboxylate transporter receptor subunit TctC
MLAVARRNLVAGLFSAAASPLHAQPVWPNKPISLLHGFPPGGPVDSVARVISDALARRLGQPVIVESRPGAAGTTAANFVARAAADGYTLIVIPATYAAAAAMYRQLPYKPVDDFTPIGMIADFPYVIVTHGEYPIRTVDDLIKEGQSRTLTFGSPGQGSTQHLLGELLARRFKIKLQHIPYRGGAAALNDLLGKRIDLMIDPPVAPLEHIKVGTLRGLAVTSAKRFFSMPDVPTLDEAGLAGFDVTGWTGVLGPAKLPGDVVDQLHSEMKAALGEPSLIDRLHAVGAEPHLMSPAAFKQRLIDDIARWTGVVAEAKIERI